ncbi:MAG TPA: DUF2007 domain-containing protein [Candidatus Methylacidiphilales bacterium]
MTTVATFSSLAEAFLLKSFLEGDGIPVLVPDEFTIQNGGFGSMPLGGVRVQVPEDFAERALALAATFRQESEGTPGVDPEG